MASQSITAKPSKDIAPSTAPAMQSYAGDEPITTKQKKMRAAHMASYVHEHMNHALDHVSNAVGKTSMDEVQYDLHHAVGHLADGADKSRKLVETTHKGGQFNTGRDAKLKRMDEHAHGKT